ncbi:hypothetical protein F4781DRAFT_427920 [Annulohypoxylon bovei var. microspora]|nr:hypothetical protein F4781DRAFT_427920 [Annulohypoxylon bovei var. microspora]
MKTRSQSSNGSGVPSTTSSATSGASSSASSSRTPGRRSTRTPSPRSASQRSTLQRAPSKPRAKLLDDKHKIKKLSLPARRSSGSSRRSSTSSIQDSIEVKILPRELEEKTESTQLKNLKIYMDGCPGRLYSILDVEHQEKLYHYKRDADKPIRITLLRGRVESIQNADTEEWLYRCPGLGA